MNPWILLAQTVESVILSPMDQTPEKRSGKGRLSASGIAALRHNLLKKQALIEQQAASLERRNERIEARDALLQHRDQLIETRDTRIRQLEELIRLFQQRQFGPSSEKLSPDQLGLFNEAEEQVEEPDPVGAEVRSHMRRSRGRPALPEDLPREEIVYDLSEDEKLCPYDGAALKLIGDERSEQLEIIPATFKVICLPLLRAIRGHRNQAQATPGQEHCRTGFVGLYRHRQVP